MRYSFFQVELRITKGGPAKLPFKLPYDNTTVVHKKDGWVPITPASAFRHTDQNKPDRDEGFQTAYRQASEAFQSMMHTVIIQLKLRNIHAELRMVSYENPNVIKVGDHKGNVKNLDGAY